MQGKFIQLAQLRTFEEQLRNRYVLKDSVVPGSIKVIGTEVDPITGEVILIMDIADDRISIVTTSLANLPQVLELNTYYNITDDITSATITLPTVLDTSNINSIILSFSTSSNFNALTISPPSGVSVSYYDGYLLESNKSYELNLMFNGLGWVVGYAIVN